MNHEHDRRRLRTLGGIFADWAGIQVIAWTQAVHINTSVLLQFGGEFRSEQRMVLGIEVPEGIAQGEFFACCIEIVFATLGMGNSFGKRFECGQVRRDALANFFLEKLDFRTHSVIFTAVGVAKFGNRAEGCK